MSTQRKFNTVVTLKRACLISISLLSAACASTSPNIEPRLTGVDIPELGVISSIEVGEIAIQKSRVYEYDAYYLLTTFEHVGTGFNHAGIRYVAHPGIYAVTREDKKWKYYIATDDSFESCFIKLCSRPEGGFMESKNTDDVMIFQNVATPAKTIMKPNWKKTTFASVDKPGFRQELLYNGRSESIVRFLYREFSRDMIRPAFTQELTYDLNDGSVISFRGVRIEVLDASNVELTYRVIDSFPDWE